MPFLDSILIALDPGSLLPLPSTFVELPLSKILLAPDWPRPTLMAAGLCVKPSKNGCFNACAAVMRFCGSNVSIFIIKSMAYSDAFGIIWFNGVGTNFGNVKPMRDASLYPSGHCACVGLPSTAQVF
mgnify:CR=1 FL=1